MTPYNTVKQPKAKVRGYVFVIDGETGMPRIDDPTTVPDRDWALLSREEKEHSNAQVMSHLRRYD